MRQATAKNGKVKLKEITKYSIFHTESVEWIKRFSMQKPTNFKPSKINVDIEMVQNECSCHPIYHSWLIG